MKRVFAWLTVCLLAACLAGCGGEKRIVTSEKQAGSSGITYSALVSVKSALLLNTGLMAAMYC